MILEQLIAKGTAKCSNCSNGAATVEAKNRTEKASIGGVVEAPAPNCSKSSKCSKDSMISFLEPRLKSNNNNDEKIKGAQPATATVATVATVDLTDRCPFNTGGSCPPGCRFETKLFLRMIRAGVLPTSDGCPLRRFCNE